MGGGLWLCKCWCAAAAQAGCNCGPGFCAAAAENQGTSTASLPKSTSSNRMYGGKTTRHAHTPAPLPLSIALVSLPLSLPPVFPTDKNCLCEHGQSQKLPVRAWAIMSPASSHPRATCTLFCVLLSGHCLPASLKVGFARNVGRRRPRSPPQ